MKAVTKERLILKLLNVSAYICILIALLLVAWSFFSRITFFKDSYQMIVDRLTEFQNYIVSIEYKWLIFIVIEVLFAIKIVVPLPISCILLISGMVFPFAFAVFVNALGMAILFSEKYYIGYRFGGGNVRKIMQRINTVNIILERDYKLPKTAVLLITRLVPSFPLNSVSQLYGSMKFHYPIFLAVSLLGYLPKLISYSVAGRNVFDPFSFKFTTPLIIVFALSGIFILGLNKILEDTLSNRKEENNESFAV